MRMHWNHAAGEQDVLYRQSSSSYPGSLGSSRWHDPCRSHPAAQSASWGCSIRHNRTTITAAYKPRPSGLSSQICNPIPLYDGSVCLAWLNRHVSSVIVPYVSASIIGTNRGRVYSQVNTSIRFNSSLDNQRQSQETTTSICYIIDSAHSKF